MGKKSGRDKTKVSMAGITQVAVSVNMCLTVCLVIWCVFLHAELQNLRHQLAPVESTIDAGYLINQPESLHASYQVLSHYVPY